MELKIDSEDVEFELARSTKNTDILLGINIRSADLSEDVMTISICLDQEEFEQLRKLLEAD